MELIGPYLAAGMLLVVAGLAKAIRPDDTARALSAMVPAGLRSRLSPAAMRTSVVLVALAETVVGLAAVALPRPVTAGLVALSYSVFAVVVARALATGGPLSSCGCFGTPDTPATATHLLVNLALMVSAVAVAAAAPAGGTLAGAIAHQPVHGVPLLAASGLAAWLAGLAMGGLARLRAARSLAGVTHRGWR